jgi:hypothetical protein
MDHIPPIEWYKNQPQSLTLIEESPFDQHGKCKDSTPLVDEKEDKVLDAETPTDDPNYDATKKRPGSPTIKTSKSNMRVYLHNMVQDEIVPEYRIFFAGRQILEVDINHREAHPARRTPKDPSVKARCSPRDHPPPVDRPVKPRA